MSILIISPDGEDVNRLRQILHHPDWELTLCEKTAEVGRHMDGSPKLILCESQLGDGDWKDILRHADEQPQPPPVLVVSRHADERLWAEVLNLGGYDVLLKPFDRAEVTRVVSMAWRHGFGRSPARH